MRKIWIGLAFLTLMLVMISLLSGCDGCSGGDDFCPIPVISADGRAPGLSAEQPLISGGSDGL